MLTNAIQQLQHWPLAIELLSPAQMDTMDESVVKAALQDGFTPLTLHNLR